MTSKSSRILACLLLIGSVSCEFGGPAGPGEPDALGFVEGTVRVDGSPEAGVTVTLSGPTAHTTVTDAAGAYEFEGLSASAWVVALVGVSADLRFDVTEATVSVGPGAWEAQADFSGVRLREATVEAEVRVGGEGRSDVTVALSGPETRTGVTGASGLASFEELLPGTYTVAISGFDPSRIAFSATERTVDAANGAVVRADFAGTLLLPQPPDQPTATALGSSAIRVAWSDVSDNEDEFEVERRPDGGAWAARAVLDAEATTLDDGGLPPASTWHYRVRACNEGGCSAWSAEVSATTDDTPPAAPTGAAATPLGPNSVALGWIDASDNENGFEVERRAGAGAWAALASPAADETALVDDGLTPATDYAWRVRACNEVGCSSWSAEAEATTPDVVPDPPSGLGAVAVGPGTVELAWTDGSDNEDGFEAERRVLPEGPWTALAGVPADADGMQDTGLAPGTAYAWRVRACNEAGCSAWSAEATATTPDVPPLAPTGLQATATGSSTVALSWTDASDNESDFQVERRSGGGGAWMGVATVAAGVTGWGDAGLPPGTAWDYRVRACNDAGCSDPSNVASATTFPAVPTPPTGLAAVPAGADAVDLTWTDASDDETRFDVERSTGGGPWTVVASPGPGTQAHQDGSLASSTTYSYRVRACNGAGCSVPSNEASATTGVAGPNLSIGALTLTQRVQRLSGDVPLVADLPAHLRVYAVASEANAFQPSVEVQLYHGGSLVHTETLAAGGAGVPLGVDPSSLGSSWNWTVPAALIQPELTVLARVDPEGGVVESDEGDNAFPPSGVPGAVEVWSPPSFDVTFVPVLQSVNGRLGDVDAGSAETFMGETRRMFPIADDDVVVHASYTTDAAALQSNDGNGAWGTVLSEINALRVAEGSSRYYYGVVDPDYGGGIAGIGYIGWPAALGWDRLPSGSGVAAHEWGHNLGRRHSPGCGAGSPDPDYPHANGLIGAWGWDLGTASLRSPSVYYDLMTYCGPEWISDYVYEKLLEARGGAPDMAFGHGPATSYRTGAPAARPQTTAAPGPPEPGLLVWGRVDEDGIVLEPAFPVEAAPSLPPAGGGGALRVEGRAAGGDLLFARSFDPVPLADGRPGEAHFAFVVPQSALGGLGLDRLELSGAVGTAVREAGAGPVAVAPAPSVSSAPGGDVEVSWDASVHPMVLVRDAVTGQVLSLARGGSVRVRPPSARIELVFSHGLGGPAPVLRTVR